MLFTASRGAAIGAILGHSRQLSLAQSRGVMFLSLAYLLADSSTIGRSSFSSGVSQSETKVHFLPSHCWMRTFGSPSWLAQESLSGAISPSKLISLMRLSSRLRFSNPQ